MAMIDSGSPVSLIKNNYIPQRAYTPISNNNDSYFGINNTPLSILGSFETNIIVNEISTKIKFLIVPDNTMSFAALLGRDFITSPNIKISMNKNCKILINDNEIINDTCVETNNLIRQIMHIEYLDKSEITDNLNINPNINFVTKEKLKEIYTETYAAKNNTNTINSEVEMNIVLKHNQPITFRPRRLSFSDKEKLQEILDDLLKNNIIRESNSPYASPIVLVRKKNNELRLCIDYREINKITVKDNFPTPLIDDHLDKLRNKRYFSNLDLRNGFYHIKMAKESIKFTSFVTPLSQFEFLQMPFGLTNAPRIFQRFINNIFSRLNKENKLLIYLDFSRNGRDKRTPRNSKRNLPNSKTK